MSELILTQAPPEGDNSVHDGDPHDQSRALLSTANRVPLTPNEKKSVRFALRRYLERSEAAKAGIHYSQARPMSHLGKSPEQGFTADCSGHATGAFYWAQRRTSIPVLDPNGLNFNGAGWTGTLLAENRSRTIPGGRRYFIGDLALYGHGSKTTHVVICRKGGTATDSIWTSHGSEAGPYAVRLHYRTDLLVVVRAWSLQ